MIAEFGLVVILLLVWVWFGSFDVLWWFVCFGCLLSWLNLGFCCFGLGWFGYLMFALFVVFWLLICCFEFCYCML